MRRQLMKLHRVLLEQGRFSEMAAVFRLLHRGWIHLPYYGENCRASRVLQSIGMVPKLETTFIPEYGETKATFRIPGGII